MRNQQLINSGDKLRMPGATLVTRLKVYDTVGPDGQRGGTPHFHFLCTEMYFVLSGSGAVELIDYSGFSRVELNAHSALVFSPGTIHRLINPDGNLEILVIMQNSGLPERGDNIVCFSPESLESDSRFSEAMQVETEADAQRRRDRGVEGFLAMKAAFDSGPEQGRAALEEFYGLAARRISGRLDEWERIIAGGAMRETQKSVEQLAALREGATEYLLHSDHSLVHPGEFAKLGFCGRLNRYFDPATLAMDGVVK